MNSASKPPKRGDGESAKSKNEIAPTPTFAYFFSGSDSGSDLMNSRIISVLPL
jgi:hypothetical protein